MPRVSPEYLEARRQQILDAARRCFIRNGFHATSMHDILAEAELSAGAVYNYFAGKDAIIDAIAADALCEIAAAVEPALTAAEPPPVGEVLALLLATIDRLQRERGLASLALQVWAEAARTPALHQRAVETIATIRGWFSQLVAAERGGAHRVRGEAADAAGRLLASLVPGFILQIALLGDINAADAVRGLEALGLAPVDGKRSRTRA